jgi:ABC-type multidrug transport system fused ATPase/permease subunit
MATTSDTSYFQAFKWIFNHLPRRRVKQFWLLSIGMACSALLETSALAAIAFFASTVADPEAVLDSEYINILRQHLDSGFLFSIQGFIVGTGIVMIILVISKNIIKSFVSYWVTRFGATLEIHFGKILLGGFLNMDYEWHLSRNSADLVMAMNWRTYFGRSFIMPILKLFNDLLMVIVMLLALLIVQPVISLIVLIVIGGTGAFIYGNIRRRLDKIARVARDYSLAINKEVTMAIHGVKDVKISKKESKFEKKFTDNAIPLARIVGLQQFFSGFPVFILETAGFIMLAVSIWLMMFFSGSSTAVITGTIALLAVTAWRVLPAVSRILGSITQLRNSLPFIIGQIKYVNQIENIAISSEQVKKPVMSAPIFENSIKFEKVSFSYNGTDIEVLRDLDFVIEKGETIGIIGTSGAGKSTLVELITGLFTPSKGRILVDGKVLNKDLLPDWLGLIGYVPQSTYIYDGTLAENVAFGSQGDEIDRDRVIECCNMASMQDFMDNMPNGIDSFIGERGVKLSGGQQQRVAIARALYDGPEIMIFDEATSSLDTRSEKAIQKTIYSFKGKQTLIVIAHRLSTVTDCDYLIWLENGRVKKISEPGEILAAYRKSMKDEKLAAAF